MRVVMPAASASSAARNSRPRPPAAPPGDPFRPAGRPFSRDVCCVRPGAFCLAAGSGFVPGGVSWPVGRVRFRRSFELTTPSA
ncbi:hypothetical protein SCA03_19940 [Streptomyces cacaoi]|uniref:Uncharacterized protein n=1 Tax=Streptomyces cacaoi TaxID=1898 RepID=A0A4Y3QXW3_STRCI|nr:hypothetical protein SCA03_19940 [Streptomyces cacaoi]